MPGSLLSDDHIDRLALYEDPSTEFARCAEIRTSAQQAYFKAKEKDVVQRAQAARSRKTRPDDIKVGSVVYVWRSSPRGAIRGWVGPGVAVCLNEPKTSVWISMRGVLIKTNIDRVRLATDSEWLGAELIKVLSDDAQAHVARKGQAGYVDASNEDGPDDDDDDAEGSDKKEAGNSGTVMEPPEHMDTIPEGETYDSMNPSVEAAVPAERLDRDISSTTAE